LSGAPHLVKLLALHTNIRLGSKGLPGKNVPAYYDHSSITAVKGFIKLGPVANVIKLFTAVSYDFS